jgi:hypothetical protein
MESFTIQEAAKMLKIEPGRIREWISRKYIIPTEKTFGPGTPNLLTRKNLYELVLFFRILSFGIPRETAAAALKNFEDPENSTGVLIFSLGGGLGEVSCIKKSGKFAISIDEKFRGFCVINYGDVKEKVDKMIS